MSPAYEKRNALQLYFIGLYFSFKKVTSKRKCVVKGEDARNCVSNVDLHVKLGINVNVKRKETNKPS